MAVARRVGEPIPIPEEISVLEEDGKTIHILQIQVRMDVTEFKDSQEILEATWTKMAWTVKDAAQDLQERWDR